MTAIQAWPAYDGLLLPLRQRWSAVGVGTVTALFTPLSILDRIQRGPYDADLCADWMIRPSDTLRVYLRKLDEIVTRQFHLTDAAAPAWWVRQGLHIATVEDDPARLVGARRPGALRGAREAS